MPLLGAQSTEDAGRMPRLEGSTGMSAPDRSLRTDDHGGMNASPNVGSERVLFAATVPGNESNQQIGGAVMNSDIGVLTQKSTTGSQPTTCVSPVASSYAYVYEDASTEGLDVRQQEFLNLRCLGWADMLTTGVDERQLRGAIDRGLIELGEKGVHGRLTFSLAERFAVQIIRELTKVWLPISVAASAGQRVKIHLNSMINYHRKEGSQKQTGGVLTLQVGYDDDTGLSIRYLIGDREWKPGRGAGDILAPPRSSVVVSLSYLLDDFLIYSAELSRSSTEVVQ